MFKATHTLRQQDIIIFESEENIRILSELRKDGKDGHLICPVCKQEVHVRAGSIKRWHFAHKKRSNCPLRGESEELLKGRYLLYQFLRSKFGDSVTIEKYFEDADIPRPVDCWVERDNGNKIAFWLLDRGFQNRHLLRYALERQGCSVVYIPLASMRRFVENRTDEMLLTPTERDCLLASEYSEIYGWYDYTLSYLDVDENKLITYRGLRCVHSPNVYAYSKCLSHPLNEIFWAPKTNELVHPKEHDALVALTLRKQREEEERQRKEQKHLQAQRYIAQRKASAAKELEMQRASSLATKEVDNKTSLTVQEQSYSDFSQKSYPCSECGAVIQNPPSIDLATNTCRCRECLQRIQKREIAAKKEQLRIDQHY